MTTGIHHITAISGPPQQTVDFYAGVLGLRFVKKTVNFDDPGTYHLYFADDEARPGSALTFFPWSDGMAGRDGRGHVTATAYAVAPGAVDAWVDRLAAVAEPFEAPAERFGARVLPLRAPDGLAVELVETDDASGQWQAGPVPPAHALGAFHSATLASADPDATLRVLTTALGYREHAAEDGRLRLVNPRADRAQWLDVLQTPPERAGRIGTGTHHHIAFRVPTDEAEAEVRDALRAAGLDPTPVIDRTYFHSVYAREPGGILFEIATDGPGFAVDEPADALGRTLPLPPHAEPMRARIEARLVPITLPY
jgi:glyoxalase family protein